MRKNRENTSNKQERVVSCFGKKKSMARIAATHLRRPRRLIISRYTDFDRQRWRSLRANTPLLLA
jgi:hypothetical protein